MFESLVSDGIDPRVVIVVVAMVMLVIGLALYGYYLERKD